MRIESVTETDLIELVNKNLTMVHNKGNKHSGGANTTNKSEVDQEENDLQTLLNLPLGFISGDHVSLRGKKYLMIVDKLGYAYYFFTRDNKKFFFNARVWVGGVLAKNEQEVD